jgi:hypothetical protein
MQRTGCTSPLADRWARALNACCQCQLLLMSSTNIGWLTAPFQTLPGLFASGSLETHLWPAAAVSATSVCCCLGDAGFPGGFIRLTEGCCCLWVQGCQLLPTFLPESRHKPQHQVAIPISAGLTSTRFCFDALLLAACETLSAGVQLTRKVQPSPT